MTQLEDIIKGCVAGKPAAQEALYKKFSGKLFGVGLRYTKDYSSAEDVLQESFIKIFNNISTFKGTGSLEGWLRRIVINTALERYRKYFQLYAISDVQESESSINYDNVLTDISAKDLIALIQELPPAYRMVFNLYAIDGYSHKEIGDILDISIGTSKSNLSRARKLLQMKVNKHFILPDEEISQSC
ncbi:MAG: RNA polymerase sigma factor [Bacteroidales bacterium]